MLFNSLDFALFLPLVFGLYWWIGSRNVQSQNWLIVGSSYLFYAWWDWRFLFLMFFSTATDFILGRLMATHPRRKKLFLGLSLAINIGMLGFFKYFNFFAANFVEAFSFFGTSFSLPSLEIVLPVGISFYTFQTLSYSIDVYRGQIQPSRNFIAFMAFVSFFPQLVAGPIERASHLFPQFTRERSYSYASLSDGLRQILWGLFKKVVIADFCAMQVNGIFDNYQQTSGIVLAVGAVLFAFQIYCDFSGYSDIAIGTARLFGIQLMRNFNFPYFSRDIAEFWRRWHISLSTWFRDYVYIPLGGSRGARTKVIRNIFAIFLISGFWHGANWTFIAWGLIHALFFLPLLLLSRHRTHHEIVAAQRALPTLKEFLMILLTFAMTSFAWIFFRAETMTQALEYIQRIATTSFSKTALVDLLNSFVWDIGPGFILILLVFIVVEWVGRREHYAIEKLFARRPRFLRWSFYYLLILLTYFYSGNEQEFIYFQF